jgi:hypothetical protein
MCFSYKTQYSKWMAFLLVVFFMFAPIPGVTSQEIAVSSESATIPITSATSHQSAMIVYYTETLGGTREAMESASLTLFSDGYALIYRPAYMKHAGTYETYLEASTLDHLWQMLTDNKILGFDSIHIHNKIHEVKQQQATLFSTIDNIADAPTTLVEIYPNRFQPPGMLAQGDWDAKMTISWRGLKWTAEQFPTIEEIQYLHVVQQHLAALMQRSDLKKIK